jgi:hypothetical protein
MPVRVARRIRLAVLLPALLACATARADLQDEIQVYDDAINAPGETGLELHANTTLRGQPGAAQPPGAPGLHALRLTPEFSLGWSPSLEFGAYLPSVTDSRGPRVAGLKLRLKYLPLRPQGGEGSFGGVNIELSRLGQRYSEVRSSAEARFIAGYRTGDWLLAVNPTLGFGLSDGQRGHSPDLQIGTRLARALSADWALGIEHYAGLGTVGHLAPWSAQDQRLFLTLDRTSRRWGFNLGLGRGFSPGADRWTLKSIVDWPLD